MRTRRGRGPAGLWGWPSSRTERGGRLALETSCPGGCLQTPAHFPGGKSPLQGPERPCLPSPKGKVSRSLFRESS